MADTKLAYEGIDFAAPVASSTAGDVKFSLAISSSVPCCRSASATTAS